MTLKDFFAMLFGRKKTVRKTKSRETGMVRDYNPSTGRGVIESNSGMIYNFFSTGLNESVRQGDEVAFDVDETNDGPVASNIVLS